MRISEAQSHPNSPMCVADETYTQSSLKCLAWLQLPSPALRTLETHGPDALGRSGAARAPLVDSITTRISAASRTPASCSWWFSTSNRRVRVDLERSAPLYSMDSPIVMVASTPARRYHLALVESARTPPASSCTTASQWREQKRFIVQRRSALSTALWSATARAMHAGLTN